MRRVMQRSAARIQSKMELCGHFWEARFHRRRITDKTDLMVTIAYDHLNPVNEKMVQRPEQYVRSSAGWWAAKTKTPIQLVRRPLPFRLQRGELRGGLLHYQESRLFDEVTRSVRSDGLSPRSARGRALVLERLAEAELAAETAGPRSAP